MINSSVQAVSLKAQTYGVEKLLTFDARYEINVLLGELKIIKRPAPGLDPALLRLQFAFSYVLGS
jgi:hypothetical protein